MRTTDCANAYLKHVFNNDDIAGVGDASGLQNSAAAGDLYLSLHSADPGIAGVQTTSELSYTGYARKAVARDSSNWTVSGLTAKNTLDILFDACTAGSGTATYVGIGTASTGAGRLLYRCQMSGSRAISAGITPTIDAEQLVVTEYDTIP